ncbi:MAG: peptide-binding protein [Pseudomonadaceae bacterium]|nr:peptide-binding protein [Pseudomonadaceae bacterium]
MLFLSLLLLTLSACTPDTPATPPQDYTTPPASSATDTGDRLNLTLLGDATGLLPFLAGEASASEIAGHIYNSLLTYDKDLNLVCEICAKYDISNNGKTITFTLKDDITFSDGTPLTSADVLATYRAITHPNTRTPYAGDYLLVQKAEAPTPRTFRVTYAEPFVPALASWAGLTILPKKVLDETPDDINATSLKTAPLGSGPYQLVRWRRGQDVLLQANPHSWQHPKIGQYYYRIIPDEDTQFMELKAGNVDIASLKPLAYNRQTDAPWFTSSYTKLRYLSNGYTYMGFNLTHPLFADTRVRQALSYAIDRQGIINAVLFGQGLPMAGVFKPGTWAYNENLQPYPYNPQKARQLLAEAGWADTDGDGLLDKNGTPFRFTVVTNQGNEARLKTAQIMQSFFRDIGIEMSIRVQEWSTFVSNTIRNRAFDAILLGWSLSAEPDPYDIWHSSKTKPEEFNIIGFANPQADTLMDKARHEFNQAKRKEYLDAFQTILHEEQPYLWLYAPYSLLAVHKRIVGISPTEAAGISYNQPDWYVPAPWHLRPQLQP